MRVTQMPSGGRGAAMGKPFNLKQPVVAEVTPEKRNAGIDIKKILSRFEKDDYILAGLILVLIFEGCDDYILLAALGYLFVMGLKE